MTQEKTFQPKFNLNKKYRIWEIDFIRGICVILMIFDHIMYDFGSFAHAWDPDIGSFMYQMGKLATWYWTWNVRTVLRTVIVCFFFGTSGISSSFSKSNLMRGLRLVGVAYLLTIGLELADIWFSVGVRINFGVLHGLAASILFYTFLRFLKLDRYTIAAVGVVIIVSGCLVKMCRLHMNSDNYFYVILGIASPHYVSTVPDYFPMLPWTGVFLLGAVIGQMVYKPKKTVLPKWEGGWSKPVRFVGRHALLLYFAHQIVVYGAFMLAGIILGYGL